MVVTTRSRDAIANPPSASQAKPVKRVGNDGRVGGGSQIDAKASKKSAPKKPAPKKPVPKKPASKKPAAKKPVTKKPVTKQSKGKKRSAIELDSDNEASDHGKRPAKFARLESPPAPFRQSPEPVTPGLAALVKCCRQAFESDFYQPEEVVLYFSDKEERRRYFRNRIIRRGYKHRRCRHKSAAECARKHRGEKGERATKVTEDPAGAEADLSLQKVTFENLQALIASTTTNTGNNITLSSATQSETSADVPAPVSASKKRDHTVVEPDNIQPVRKSAKLSKDSDATVARNTTSTSTTTTTNSNSNMKANPVEISDTSSSGSSSEDEASPPTTDKNPMPGSATQSQTPATGVASAASADEVINVRARPNIQKPDFTMPTSSLGAKMPAFLAQMAAANKELQEEVAAGKKVGIEVDDGDEEEQHIEMNLGLGVLEEKKDGDSSSEEEDEDSDSEEDVMQRLRGEKKEKGKEKEVGIQEL